VLVAEKRTGGSEIGAGLQLSPNASHILRRWGLSETLAAAAVAPERLDIRRWGEADAFAGMPVAPGTDGAPFLVILRADLHSTLRKAALAQPGVDLREDHAFDGMSDAGGVNRLRFVAGRQALAIEATAVVGADGIWSKVRQALGDSRSLDPARWEAWRTVIPAAAAPAEALAPVTNLWLRRDAHAVHYPVAAGRFVNLVVIRAASGEVTGWDGSGDAARLAPLASTAGPPLRKLIAAAPSWAVWTLRDRSPALRLADGSVALVGDAAHPLLPFLAQGAAMAIEDAEVLAASLPRPAGLTAESAAAGLRAYAETRAARVHRVFSAARANAFAYHLPAPFSWARDLRLASLGPDGMRQRYSWLYDWRSDAARD
jgi:salicylate hydroxylase